MRKNLLKQLALALLLTVAVPCVNAQIAHVGDILCTSGVYVSPAEYEASGLEAMGVIFYVDATGQHGWAVALQNVDSCGWSDNTYDTPLPNFPHNNKRAAIYDLDGLFNTQEVLNFGANNNYSYPAFEAMDVANGWYLPAIGQLNYLYGNLVEVNFGLGVVGGALFSMTSNWSFWSSTEMGNQHAWALFSYGKVDGGCWKIDEGGVVNSNSIARLVRGVRNF